MHLLGRLANDLCHQSLPLRRRSAASRSIFLNSRQSLLGKAISPAGSSVRISAQIVGDLFVSFAIRRSQYDLGSQDQACFGRAPAPI